MCLFWDIEVAAGPDVGNVKLKSKVDLTGRGGVMCIGIGFGLNLNRCILILEWIYGRFGETGDYWVFFLVFMGHARDFLMYIGIIITRNY